MTTIANPRCIIVVPCLNEIRHIGALLDTLVSEAASVDGLVVVSDGGSTDGTREFVVGRAATEPLVRFCDNPRRIQSAAVNRAVEEFGQNSEFLIRIDAHASYPAGYCETLIAEAQETGATCVVVSMLTVGKSRFQAAVAMAQNARMGNGGSPHRSLAGGRWVDHGHHALMRIDAFRSVGGYDETFTQNEDAELDHRFSLNGGRIWLTARTRITYYPRTTPISLIQQYMGYGTGRARNMLKHRIAPKPRQILPMFVVPALFLAPMSMFSTLFAAPVTFWTAACLTSGLIGLLETRKLEALLAGFAAALMHLGWSIGFWRHVLPRVVSGYPSGRKLKFANGDAVNQG